MFTTYYGGIWTGKFGSYGSKRYRSPYFTLFLNSPAASNCLVLKIPDLYAELRIHTRREFNMEVKDSNGNILNAGDSVHVIKDLKVRGSSTVIKRGTVVKNIRLTDNEDEVEGKVDGSMMVLRVEFLKKK